MYPQKKQFDAIVGLKQALAQPEQEPVAWMYHDGLSLDKIPSDMMGTVVISRKRIAHYKNERPLIFGDTAPPNKHKEQA